MKSVNRTPQDSPAHPSKGKLLKSLTASSKATDKDIQKLVDRIKAGVARRHKMRR